MQAVSRQLDEQPAEGIPPLERWNPEFCGDIDMRIARNGTWYYMGTPIGRQAMVDLFSRVLWKEGDRYFLKTPVEKVGIEVEDAPFLMVACQVQQGGQGRELVFTSSNGDRVVAGEEHPLRVEIDPASGEPSPYIRVRFGMDGLISRPVFYQLVELAELEQTEQGEQLVVESCGHRFSLGRIDDNGPAG
uniref:DUF1285 domain-containing protein n=1 Tax=Marinobacterium arenosum TaxID=2862496 RepID=UPI002102FF9B|nr:DUF1285 domain-containing protein [Marinobacterium arenosum]